MKHKRISVMIKPSSALCNLKCTYCFYRDEAENRIKGIRPFISEETTDSLIRKIGESAESALVAFQGGEPSLIGLDYFRSFIEKEKQLAPKTLFEHAFQTNGYTLDDEWAAFFKENNFLVGVSFDGSRKIHDYYRPARDGGKTASRILSNIEILKKHEVDFNILIVVTSMIADNPDHVWSFMHGKNLRFLQFIPCMDMIDGKKEEYSLTTLSYRNFLCRLFDLYYDSILRGEYVSVRLFDNFVHMVLGMPPESCDLCGRCSVQYVCESDGQVYPCDFYSLDKYVLGDINKNSIEEIDERRRDIRFIESSITQNPECNSCPAFVICRGGCPRYRKDGKYIYCECMKDFYSYAAKRLVELAKMQ